VRLLPLPPLDRNPMARPNYSGEKRRKELEKQRKKAEKKRRKMEQASAPTDDSSQIESPVPSNP
jgi:hypothetical protein